MSTAERHQPRPPLALVTPPARRPRGRPWSATDDDALRAGYRRGQAVALATELDRTVNAVRQRALEIGLTQSRVHVRWSPSDSARYQRDQDTITRLRGEVQRLRDRPPLEPAYAPGDDARRLATLIAWRLSVVSAAQAAVVLGVPVERLPVELGRAAARGLDVVTEALSGGDA
jgi:hypothetical protein